MTERKAKLKPSRTEINKAVATHLRHSLSWCFDEGGRLDHYVAIRAAKSHDEMVAAVKTLLRYFGV